MMDLKKAYEERRSVNYFDKDKKLDDSTLREIIELASLAPSAFNLQPWEVIAVRSDEVKEKLYNEACNQPKVLDASVTLVVIGDTLGYRRHNSVWDEKIKNGLPEEKANGIIDYSENNLYPSLEKKIAFAVRNSSLFSMAIMHAAKYYGVDSHPMIGFNEDKIKEIFAIEDSKTVTMLIALGYHDESKEIKPRDRRLTYSEIVREV